MKISTVIIIAGCIVSVFIANQAFADSSEVHIINTVNSSNSTTSSSNCHTTIHRMVNGQEQDITSDTCGDIHMGDTNNKVDVTTKTGSTAITVTPPDISSTIAAEQQKITEKLDKAKTDLEKKKKQVQMQQKNILQKIADIIKNLFLFFPF